MRTTFHFLLVNLAVADLQVVVFYLPATLVGHIFGPWILGLFICKAATYLQGVSVCASVHTLVAISIDRFLAICHPMKCQMTSRGCKFIIVAIWVVSFVLLLPWVFYFRLTPMYSNGNYGLQVCQEVWPTERMEMMYFVVANLLLCYLLPLSVISLCYILIWRRVWLRKLPGEAQEQEVERMIQRSKIKVAKMLLVVIVVFAVSWLPLYAIFARIKIGDKIIEGTLEDSIVSIVAPVAQWLGASNSCINPVLYVFFNSKFRTGFKVILFKRYCCRDIDYQDERDKTFRNALYLSRKTKQVDGSQINTKCVS
ncbi:neuropeptide SIFamide receptor-like [Centruroides sculpturatus]|uniref:neuropeptide SIFamide receptor-like n=1 Tax=Centruroides sculpturatus TaxID=218467 RepID=UPI000C6E4B15|nr:neuropeptide SIFamide receptor-like [Centruroides sculpturatus]